MIKPKRLLNEFKDYDKSARQLYGTYYDELVYDGKDYNGSLMSVNEANEECICCGMLSDSYYIRKHRPNCELADDITVFNYRKVPHSYFLTLKTYDGHDLQAYKNKDVTNQQITKNIAKRAPFVSISSLIFSMLVTLSCSNLHNTIDLTLGISLAFLCSFVITALSLDFYKEFYVKNEYGVDYAEQNVHCKKYEYCLPIKDEEQLQDIAYEYNAAIKNGDSNHVRIILDNLDKEQVKHTNKVSEDFKKHKQDEDAENIIRTIERYKTNSVLQGIPLSESTKSAQIVLSTDKVNVLDKDLSERNKASIMSLIDHFNSIDATRSEISSSDLIKFDTCKADFYVCYNKLLLQAELGVSITKKEIKECMNVVYSCSDTLQRISSNFNEKRMNQLKTSNMFLKEKYNIV